MRVRFWGVRGSIPVPGEQTVRYGGNTVCVEVRLADGTMIVLDAGTGLRGLGQAMVAERFDGEIHTLLSHIHWDHILGMPFCPPLIAPGAKVFRYPLASADQEKARANRPFFAPPFFPVTDTRLFGSHGEGGELTGAPDIWPIGSALVRRIALNHPDDSQGFRIDDADGSSLAYLTDNELSTAKDPEAFLEDLATFSRGVDLLIHDSQYVDEDMPAKRGWGHSTVSDVLRLAQKAKPRRVVLFHHDPGRTDDALDRIGRAAQRWLTAHAPDIQATVAKEGWAVDLPEKPKRRTGTTKVRSKAKPASAPAAKATRRTPTRHR